MTREEERIQAACAYAIDECMFNMDDGNFDTNKNAFIGGAEWADKHPRKGLVDIEKVYKVIKDLYTESGIEYAEMLIQIIRQKLEE